jgi:hypothetical protein
MHRMLSKLLTPAGLIGAVAVGAAVFAIEGSLGYLEPGPTPRRARRVPQIEGRSLCWAQRALQERGMTVAKVVGRAGDEVELPARVVDQIPGPFEEHRDVEPVVLTVAAVDVLTSQPPVAAIRLVKSRRDVARVLLEAGMPEAAVLGRGRPRTLLRYESGVCEPVFVTIYQAGGDRVALLQTVGGIVPQGRDIRLRSGIADRVGGGVYWRERFYVLGVSARPLAASMKWVSL